MGWALAIGDADVAAPRRELGTVESLILAAFSGHKSYIRGTRMSKRMQYGITAIRSAPDQAF